MAFAKRPVRPAAPQTGLDPVITKLTTLGLDHPAAVLPELIEQAARDDLSPLTFLDLLLTSQLERKDERRIATMLKLSGLPPGKTLEGFDWGFQPKADRRQDRSARDVSVPARQDQRAVSRSARCRQIAL